MSDEIGEGRRTAGAPAPDRVLAALHGSRKDAPAREQAEAETSRYPVAQAQQRLVCARAGLAKLEARQAQLAGAGLRSDLAELHGAEPTAPGCRSGHGGSSGGDA